MKNKEIKNAFIEEAPCSEKDKYQICEFIIYKRFNPEMFNEKGMIKKSELKNLKIVHKIK